MKRRERRQKRKRDRKVIELLLPTSFPGTLIWGHFMFGVLWAIWGTKHFDKDSRLFKTIPISFLSQDEDEQFVSFIRAPCTMHDMFPCLMLTYFPAPKLHYYGEKSRNLPLLVLTRRGAALVKFSADNKFPRKMPERIASACPDFGEISKFQYPACYLTF